METKVAESFENKLCSLNMMPLRATGVQILQLNITRRCNLCCKHCHVNASPKREEIMSREILEACLNVIDANNISVVDITGGSPEMHPDLAWFLKMLARPSRRIIVRTNLVILLNEPWRRYLEIYSKLGIELVGSLPDYNPSRTDRQRGENTFIRSIEALKELNKLGYGMSGSNLQVHLVHNPAGAYLPASQKALETEYKKHLLQKYGVHFNNLFVIVNMPIGRFMEFLQRSENYDGYMEELISAFNPVAVENVMCRTTISVDWEGYLYDCDFNQMLGLKIKDGPSHIFDFDYDKLSNRKIVVGEHCFGCTAGAGSSCQGETVK